THAALVNSMMAYRSHLTSIIDRVYVHLNLPSRGELDTALKRIQELRRENRKLQREMSRLASVEDELEGLRKETGKLARQVAALSKPAAKKPTRAKRA
ncbi:MAG: hypothetical protein LJE84_10235, partial [Gammaproteobacteria bacterium]|nr:hypothetical protein [Gammaproteobacteria bacterium]